MTRWTVISCSPLERLPRPQVTNIVRRHFGVRRPVARRALEHGQRLQGGAAPNSIPRIESRAQVLKSHADGKRSVPTVWPQLFWKGAAMSIRTSLTALTAVAVVAFLGIAEVHSAQTEDVRLRGKVLSLNGSTLWVKTREGTDEGWR